MWTWLQQHQFRRLSLREHPAGVYQDGPQSAVPAWHVIQHHRRRVLVQAFAPLRDPHWLGVSPSVQSPSWVLGAQAARPPSWPETITAGRLASHRVTGHPQHSREVSGPPDKAAREELTEERSKDAVEVEERTASPLARLPLAKRHKGEQVFPSLAQTVQVTAVARARVLQPPRLPA